MKPTILLGHLTDKRNEGAIIRTAEAFGINAILILGDRKPWKTAQGAENHMIYCECKDIKKVLNVIQEDNLKIVCIENTKEAVSLNEAVYPANPIFVTGNESLGVPKDFLDNAALVVKIPQAELSYTRCLNTSNAMAIVLYDWFHKERVKRKYEWK